MKVLIAAPHWPPDSRVGAWLASHSLMAHLVRQGHHVTVYRYLDQCGDCYALDGVAVESAASGGGRQGYEWAKELAVDVDVVAAHCNDAGFGAALACDVGRPLVMLYHGGLPTIAETADLVVFNSDASRAASDWAGRSIVVHPYTDVDAVRTTPGDLVTLINLSEAKGGELFGRIARSMPHRRFLGVKNGYETQLGVGAHRNVIVTPSTSNMRDDVYARTRILLMPSEHETWGMVGVEAMASGIPVIAHPTSGLVESLGAAGIFVDRDNGQGWLDAIERLDDPEEYELASKRARARSDELAAVDGRAVFADALEEVAGARSLLPRPEGKRADPPSGARGHVRVGVPGGVGQEGSDVTGPDVAVLVPRRADHGRRDQLWHWLKDRWSNLHPDWAVHEGQHLDGPFNRSAALNSAAAAAGEWDVAVITDSDTFCDPGQVRQAVDLAAETNQITFAFTTYRYLRQQMSDLVMDGFTGNWMSGVEFSMTGTCSSMVVVSRHLWDQVGGFDEGFIGWGFEDVGFSLACQAIGGGMSRIPGDVWHLHHPVSPENDQRSPLFLAGQARMQRYADCNYDPTKMRALLAELGVNR